MTENLRPTNIQKIIEAKAGDKKEALIKQIKEKYGEERLTLTLETAEEIAQAEQEIMQMAEKWTEDPARKEQAEDEINKLPGVKEKLDGIEKVEDLATLSVDILIKLEDYYPGILLYAFTDITDEKQKLDFANWQGYSNILPGTKFQVDFRGNPEAEAEIGAGELLPPSVRSIVVYENGDQNNARISKRRIGLKSRNDDAHGAKTGFFDENGYMPVFTEDVIEINGDPGVKVVDKNFEKKFTKEESGETVLDYEKYNASEEAKEDEKFLNELFEKNPAAQRGKTMSAEEMDQLQINIEASEKGARVVEAAKKIVAGNTLTRNTCCWDFIDKVYKAAGARPHRIFQDLNYVGKDCGTHHAGSAMMARITSGDWLYYNNKNTADTHGCHSGIFMGWIDESAQIAWVCSWNSGAGASRIHKVDFKKKPVTHISKPV